MADQASESVKEPEQESSPKQSYERNILLTGGAGFIGSYVTIHFVKKYPQYRVVVLDKLTYCATVKNLSELQGLPNFVFIHGDICSMDLCRYLFDKFEIDTVIHAAAETHVDHSFGDSLSFTETNVKGTHILLECARDRWLSDDKTFKLFLHVSTDEVYGESLFTDKAWQGKKETDPLNPTNPYAGSKAAAEFIVRSYFESFKLPIMISRSNNTYGPRQYPEKVIPKFINLLDRNRPLCIYGEGKNMRCYIHGEDVARAFDAMMHRGASGEIYNVSADTELSNNDMSLLLIELMKKDPKEFMRYVPDRPRHDMRYLVNGEKLRALGWAPQVSFREGLLATIEWYRSHVGHWDNVKDALISNAHAVVRSSPQKETQAKSALREETKETAAIPSS